MELYPECFGGRVGCFEDYTYHITLDPEDYTYHITLDPEVLPVVLAPRKIPQNVNQSIMARVTQPTDWVNCFASEKKRMVDFAYVLIRRT